MGLLFIVYLQGEQVFVCAGNEGECGTHLACPEDLVSKARPARAPAAIQAARLPP